MNLGRLRSSRPPIALATTSVLLGLVLAACGSSNPSGQAAPSAAPSTGQSGTLSTAPAPTFSPTAASATRTPTTGATITKVMVLIVENHSLAAMRSGMPWTYALAQKYGYATGYHAISHPSLPNYLAISGGDTFGVVDDRSPAAHVLHGPSVFGQALAQHLTAKVYAEDQTGACAPYDHGRYAVRHNPWVYYVDEHAACSQFDGSADALAGDTQAGRLPTVGMVAPNLCDDAHDCPLANADGWMRSVVGELMSGPDFASGRLLIVVTGDEDHHDQGNLVLTTLVNPQLSHVVVSSPLDHFSLSGLLSEVSGATPLRQARTAPSIAKAFGLKLGPA